MKAIIFSSYIPTKESLTIGIEFLNMVERYFKDYDIYIGVNYGSVVEWENILKNYSNKLNINYGLVKKELSINSDISGFQKALELLKNNNKKYEIIWFGHTKGATTNRDSIRKDIFDNFFYKRDEIEKKFNNKKLGIFGRYITTNPDLKYIDNNLNKLSKFTYHSANIFYLYTFYVIKGDIISDFIDNCDNNFFTKNLLNYYGFDRYFFERDFPNIPAKYGYDFEYDVITHHPIWNINFKRKLILFGERRFKNNIFTKFKIIICIIQNKILFFFFRIIQIMIPIKILDLFKYKKKV